MLGRWLGERREVRLESMPVLMPEPVDPTFLLMESARRVDETRAIREFLPHNAITLELGEVALPAGSSSRAQRLVETMTRGVTLAELFERTGGSHFLFLENLNELLALGVLEIGEAAGLEGSEPLRETG